MPDTVEPQLSASVEERYLKSLPSPFAPLSTAERAQDWGKEILIGFGFAHQLDLYQAITAFKRAEILLPASEKGRALEVQYEILLCYYMGQRWQEVIYTFENSGLRHVDESFPALHDLLIILYDAYLHEEMETEAARTLQLIEHYFPDEGETLSRSKALLEGDVAALGPLSATYAAHKKSPGRAQSLNALLPGAGYLYLGQKQSAATAFVLNGLFIGASAYFFSEGNLAAGAIFTSFEAGWYFGGIYGAGLEAKAYNERLYESLATPLMHQERLFPVLRLTYAF
ncbi:MAG: tetratricopeptide repeat protein [Verrucomicrobia bacterium]|nr:tetratricopeptide repeat protein [Verrucomicrobiota bacterium]